MEQQTTKQIESVPGRPWGWQWPTILALDAPAVAVAWQCMLARVAGVTLRPYHVVLLGISVWLAYAADRWIEGWRLSKETLRTQRHYFFLRWRWPSFGVWVVVLVVGIGLAIYRFTSREWLASLGMLVATLLYVLSHQFLHRAYLWRLPKEICVAVIIALGAVLYPATLATDKLHLLAPSTGLFVLLCLANCLLISVWEHEVDLHHGQKSFAFQFSHARAFANALPYGILALSIGIACFSGGATRIVAWCSAASAIMLATLNAVQPKVGRELAHLLADVALLTPLLALTIL